ncbi:MAG TPA: type II secretion system protein GspM [Allosphingosinicella sp.]|nr:type II secretion system protein GspM [Allosphingosinicella sp.]
MNAWWEARSARERLLLGIMFALLGLVLAWLIVVRPLADALDAAKERHAAAVVALAEARARLPSAAGPAPAGPADAIVARTAAEAGFTGVRIARQGAAGASVAIDAARPQALFGWIAEMERRGLVVERLRAQANADRTLSAEIGLRERAR